MRAMLMLLPLALAQTDEIGGDDVYNNNGDMLKLLVFEVRETAVITRADFAVYNNQSDGDILFALYAADGDSWSLVDSTPNTANPPMEETSWASSGEVTWVVEDGGRYALGVWIDSD